MANTVSIKGEISVSDGYGSKVISRTASLTPTGQQYVVGKQVVGTATETMAIGDCSNVRYAAIINPSDSNATLTVTCAAMVLKPGDPAIFPPSTSLVTLVSTGASHEIAAGATEA